MLHSIRTQYKWSPRLNPPIVLHFSRVLSKGERQTVNRCNLNLGWGLKIVDKYLVGDSQLEMPA